MTLVGLEMLRFHIALGIAHSRVDCREYTRHVIVKVQEPMRFCRRWAEFYLWHIDCNRTQNRVQYSQQTSTMRWRKRRKSL